MDHICHLFIVEGVRLAHVREIMQELDMLDIRCRLPHVMRSVMGHVVGASMLIQILRDGNQSKSSSDDEVLSATPHHESPLAHGSGG